MVKNIFFFDGYNLIHANPHLQSVLKNNLETARIQLLESVANYLGCQPDSQGILVFDGPNPAPTEDFFSDKLKIYYGKTADLIIEKLAKNSPAETITLVSSDRTVYLSLLAKDKTILQIKSFDFWQAVEKMPREYRSPRPSNSLLQGQLQPNTLEKLNLLRRQNTSGK